ncbi:MAG: class I SAM-dependent methyltransferase [Treponema sp.]|nr:class I SAM-dependent methyltransferase [Treponema sp.]MBR5645167.1 class I SAM-dependent methyltransferase [Treponema sp.]
MSTPIENYRKMVEQPWGKIFYDVIFNQLKFQNDNRLKILDFGAGFCITAMHYGKNHDVTALEPNEEMYNLRFESDDYTLITQGLDYLKNIEDNTYDVALCHNVLEYVENKDEILAELKRVLKPGGYLSIIKHNLYGRVYGCAVLTDNPKAALDLLDEKPEDSMFGNRDVYTNEYLTEFFGNEMKLSELYGIRAFYGLSSNNEIKYTDEWYNSMLELEIRVGKIEEFKKVSFFNHLIFEKI